MQSNNRFERRVPHVTAGSPVTAANTSASTRALEDRTNYLEWMLTAIEASQLLFKVDQPIAASVVPGSAVYWQTDTAQYDLALAAMTAGDSTFLAAESSQCVGICVHKHSATSGVIGFYGLAFLSTAVLEAMFDEPVVSGRYYLSSSTPGKLTQQCPPMSVPVLMVLGPVDGCEGGANVLICPQFRDFLHDHVHHQIDLVAEPAGTHVPPGIDEQHTITSPDVAQSGWLPADHSSFAGHAPAGAKFGYNLAAHPQLSQLWPPLPIGAVMLEVHQPSAIVDSSTIHGLCRVSSEFVKFDQYGIWWMTDCYNQVPWPADLDTTNSQSLSVSAMYCPVVPHMRLLLSFVRMNFMTDKTVVTSLVGGTDEPIEFVNCFGVAAATGDLRARLKVAAMLSDTVALGGQVLKTIGAGLRFSQGWVAEGLIAGSNEVLLSSTHQRRLVPTDPASDENPTVHQGIVRVDIQRDLSERELPPQIIKLNDALEREYMGLTYIGFPADRHSSIKLRMNVPVNGLPTAPQLQLRASLFGRAVGPFAAMTVQYHRLVRPTSGSPTPLTDTLTTVTFDIVTPSDNYDGAGTNLPADRLIEVESDAFDIAAGDTVFITLARSATALPLYASEIGVVRLTGVIVAGV